MGSRKHKKHHKSDKRERILEATTIDVVRPAAIGSGEQQPSAGGLRLVLKVGGSSTASEHGDSPHPEIIVPPPPPLPPPPPPPPSSSAQTSTEPVLRMHPVYSLTSTPSGDTSSATKHKKAKKKKKKKSVEKEREKPGDYAKKHKHHHHHHHHDKKEKRKRDRDSMMEGDRDYGMAESQQILKHQILLHGHHHHHHVHNQQQAYYDQNTQYASMDGSHLSSVGGIDRPFREPRACTLKNRQGKTALQHLLDYLLKALERKDPHQFFAWPVTDSIAPGYSSIIARPMDFSTVRTKIDNNEYADMDHFKADIKLICDNAMTYNRPDTIYYKSAKKLLHVSTKITSKEKLLMLRNTLTYINELGKDELGFETEEPEPPPPPAPPQLLPPPPPLQPRTSTPPPLQTHSTQPELQLQSSPTAMHVDDANVVSSNNNSIVTAVVVEEKVAVVESKKKLPKIPKFEDVSEEEDEEDVAAQEILLQARCAAKAAADRLTLRRPNSKFGFLRQRNDGSTSLAILNPDGTKLPGKVERFVNLDMLVGKLTHGSGTIAGFKEDKRNIIKPVNYLSYGSFGSYAPSYDSTFANITKEESDLLYSTYGDETGLQYAESLMNFTRECDFVSELADSLLNALTDGDHSRTIKVIESRKKKQEQEHGPLQDDNNRVALNGKGIASDVSSPEYDFNLLRSLADEGIDVSFLDTLEKELRRDPIQKKLDETSSLVNSLARVQHARLSAKPPAHLANVSGPSAEELQLASKITDSLVELSKKAAPGNLASPASMRKAMGISAYCTKDDGDQEDSSGDALTGSGAVAPSAAAAEDGNGSRQDFRSATASAITAVQVKTESIIEDAQATSTVHANAEEQTNDLEMELREFLETEPTLRVSDSPTPMDVSLDDVIS